MSLPPIVPDCNYEPFISGDVSIAADAAIAPGVIIQAAPGCRIVVASGVCIGVGAIFHAYNGTIEIEEEVTIGAGVLVVGQAKIAAKACIGALTTVVGVDLEAEQAVAAGSILGDTSRKIAASPAPASTQAASPAPASTQAETTPSEPMATPAGTEEAEEAKAEQSHYVSPGNRYNTFIQPKPVSIPQAATPTHTEEEEEEEERATIPSEAEVDNGQDFSSTEESKYVPPGPAYHTFIQPKPVSIPQAATPTYTEEEEEEEGATIPSEAEADNGQDFSSTEESKYVPPGPAYHTFIQPKPVSIPEANTNNDDIVPAAEAEPPESEEEEKPPTPKNPVAGLDYVQGMMKTLFPHKNISLAREDEED
jgi:carbon dioxide concentrating mechanism protein CcmN